VIDVLGTLHSAGKTLVLTTHDLDLAQATVDRVVILGEDHRLHADGPTQEVLHQSDLLVRANLIHEHFHWHGAYGHSHPHHHSGDHDHPHDHPGDHGSEGHGHTH
jgi:cobalt/nickel transport system ATP-binding protein